MTSHELYRRAHAILRQYVAFTGGAILVTQVLVVIVFPIIEATLRQRTDISSDVLNTVYILHVIAGLYATYGLYRLREFTKLAAIDDIEQKQKKCEDAIAVQTLQIDELEGEILALVHRSAAVQGALSVLQGLLREEQVTTPTADHMGKLLAPLIKQRSEILGFNAKDMHNFAVYLYDEKTQELKLHFRSCDDRIQRHDRSWRQGLGHVGVAFAQGKTIISTNVASIQEFLGAGGLDTDQEYYKSFISTPILDDLAEGPVGIFVMTSSRAGQFSEEHKILAESFALILSTFLSVRSTREKGHTS